MATKISTIYDALHTKIATVLSDHKELNDNISVDKNDELALRLGYSINMGRSVRTRREITCQYWILREIRIVNTIAAKSHDTSKTIKETAEKTIFENQIKVIDALEKDVYLNDNVANLTFVSDNGIEQVFIDGENFLKIESTFTFEYYESL